jgi:uroporphyrinogen III methyltransferase/synthase
VEIASSTQSAGTVYLVGAGPGDPQLITVRGRDLLQQADVILYDALANRQLLDVCRPDAELIFVGKRAGNHAMDQTAINALLIQKANRGLQVVRLKGGDPFLFGRGGEECQALAAAGVAFQVVPGITAAIGALAYAGIPLTHRDFNASVTLITGHEKTLASLAAGSAESSDILDWASLAKLPCLVFYMAARSIERIASQLIGHGMSPDMPAAIVQWGTMPQQRTVTGTLANLAARASARNIGSPAIIAIGPVVSLRNELNWFESRPLFGQTVLVTHSPRGHHELAPELQRLGAAILESPAIQIQPALDVVAIEQNLINANTADWIVFSSISAVEFVKQRLFDMGSDVRLLGPAKIAAIGSITAQAVTQQLGLRIDLQPPEFISESLAVTLARHNEIAGKKFLLLNAINGRRILYDRLVADGAAEVRQAHLYESRPAALSPAALEAIDNNLIGWITFSSGSAVQSVAGQLSADRLAKIKSIKIASIGPATSQSLRAVGWEPTAEAKTYNAAGLARAIASAS